MNIYDLYNYKRNEYSQNGEDGILEEILKRIDPILGDQKWCVEFGAWDGIYLSNTYNLIKKNWNAVLIEGDESKFKDLEETCKLHERIIPINKFVEFQSDSQNSLGSILEKTDLPNDYEILSIDIDSYDLAVWESYNGNPKIVIIEINSSIPPGVLHWCNDHTTGNSFSSTIQVAKEKGYSLVCHTGNLIFCRNDIMQYLNIAKVYLDYPETLFKYDWINDSNSNFDTIDTIRKVKKKYKKKLLILGILFVFMVLFFYLTTI